MDRKTLTRKRGRVYTDLVRGPAGGVTKLAKQLSRNAKELATVRFRLQSYLVPLKRQTPRHMIPADMCARVARVLGKQPSELYFELTKSEKRRIERGEFTLDAAAPVTAHAETRVAAPPRSKKKVTSTLFRTPVSVPEFGVDNVVVDAEMCENGDGFALKIVIPAEDKFFLRKLFR